MVKEVRLCLLTYLAIPLALPASLVAQSNPRSPTPEKWKETAIEISQTDLSGHSDVVRQERSSLFNARTPDVRRLDINDPNRQNIESTFINFVRTAPIPTEKSDVVMIGTVDSLQPYFSADHTHLYTEFTVSVEQRFKDVTQRVQTGSAVPVVVRGGRMRLKDGRVMEDKTVDTNSTIAVGSRYVFFLHYVSAGQHFAITKSWELKNGVAIPTSSEDRLDDQQGKSRFSGATEETFIGIVKRAASINQDQQ